MKRYAKSPCLSPSPRNLLDESRHVSIDALLKELKICSRRTHVALNAFKDECQILERLYYKGKNQHRAALFWRSVIEIRRYCGRLDGMRIGDLIDALRSSFFGDAHSKCVSSYIYRFHSFKCIFPSSTKLTKGPWTHFPDMQSISFLLERLSSSSALTAKVRKYTPSFAVLTSRIRCMEG